ncbi:MAG: hypothetical protein M3R52_02950 [Acidobacteriota bacterium]|nr:hypothetical protein [Acidobacteriota bacterium]
MWICTVCGEQVDEEFHVCWNCQTEREELSQADPVSSWSLDAGSRIAAEASPPDRPIKEQLSNEAFSVLSNHLEPSESLEHWARGVVPWQYSFGSLWAGRLVLLLTALPVFILIGNLENSHSHPSTLLFLVLWYPCIFLAFRFARKKCIVGLTERRFIAISFRTDPTQEKVLKYSLSGLPQVEILNATDDNFLTIKMCDAQQPFIGNFHSEHMPDNRAQFKAIAEILVRRHTLLPQKSTTLGI